jgi:hypothetical protein
MQQISELDINVMHVDTGETQQYVITPAGSRFSFNVFEDDGQAHVQVLHDGEVMFDPQPYDADKRQLLFADEDVLPFGWWAACDRDLMAIVLTIANRLTVRLQLDPAAV